MKNEAELVETMKKRGLPVTSVSFVDRNDKNTWKVELDPSATPEQVAEAESVKDEFVLKDLPEQKDVKEKLGKFDRSKIKNFEDLLDFLEEAFKKD